MLLAPKSNCVEVFEGKTVGVDCTVATGACFDFLVLEKSVTDCEICAAYVRFDFSGVRWWRVRCVVEEDTQDVLAAFDGFGAVAVRPPLN